MITRTEIDGVPVAFTPGDGPMTAGLVFRVGRADEPLARSGLTRLTQRLVGEGEVGPVTTTFRVRGDADEVVRFLDGVCRGLTDLPVDDLEALRAVLITEDSARVMGPSEKLTLWRYGYRGHGLPSLDEPGLHAITADELRGWAARFFTAANAMLWITGGAVPAGLRLPLPGGDVRIPAPEAVSMVAETPAFVLDPDGGTVALQAIVRRGPAATYAARLLHRILGSATVTCTPRDGEHATLLVLMDSPPGQRDSPVGAITDALAAVRYGRIPPPAPAPETDDLPGYVRDELLGHTPDHGPVTRAAVGTVAAEARESALLLFPYDGTGRAPNWAGFAESPHSSDEPLVEGRRYPLRGLRGAAAIIGDDGVSMDTPGVRGTVRWAETVALVAWPDGARRLIGPYTSLRIEPRLFGMNAAAIDAIDAAVPAGRRVDMPALAPNEVPRPPGLLRRLIGR